MEPGTPLRLALARLLAVPMVCAMSCGPSEATDTGREAATPTMTESHANESTSSGPEVATFGAGCFWCVEAVLEQLDGVTDVTSGYMGGHVENPSYRAVCGGDTGHAEVVQVTFDPATIPYTVLLDWFWRLHDPTTQDRQGNDVGSQYRSAIFYHSDEQRQAAEKSRAAVEAAGTFLRPVVTEITAAAPYYVADEGHQDYYRQNREQGYCRMIITPKLDKLGLEQ